MSWVVNVYQSNCLVAYLRAFDKVNGLNNNRNMAFIFSVLLSIREALLFAHFREKQES